MERQHVVRIKIWAPDGTVRYSTDPAEVNQHFDLAGNDELREALGGEVASELAQPEKAENEGDKGDPGDARRKCRLADGVEGDFEKTASQDGDVDSDREGEKGDPALD